MKVVELPIDDLREAGWNPNVMDEAMLCGGVHCPDSTKLSALTRLAPPDGSPIFAGLHVSGRTALNPLLSD